MSRFAGEGLGHYERLSPIGAGGMGEVYRATDARLGREVAIKLLPAELAQDPERVARFEREGRLLAALNHPGIAHVYGFESAALTDGSTAHFLVMELVPGEDLAGRLKRGALPLDEAVDVARQVAEALEEAHARGIVHRDLKPANVMLAAGGRVKVLDFGLAKVWDAEAASGSSPAGGLSQSPTLTGAGTAAGVILGTAAYMSPEQARGRPVDARADLWALGVVLFEMLTGHRLFDGESVSDVLAAVLTREPPWERLPAASPPALRRLLARCLQRDPRRRLHAAADARLELEEASALPVEKAPASAAAPAAGSRRIAAGAVLLVAGAIAGWLLGPRDPAPAVPVVRFTIEPVASTAPVQYLALSRDGRRLVYSFFGQGAPLVVRELDSFDERQLSGTEGASKPFLSPDGEWLGFFQGGKIRGLHLAGGDPRTICDAPDESPGAAVGPDGTILFSRAWSGSGLWRVGDQGGEPTEVTHPDPARGETSHFGPHFLPGDRTALFTAFGGRGLADSKVAALDLATGKVAVLFPGAYPQYLASGHLVYYSDGTYVVAPFDPERLERTGSARPLDAGVRRPIPLGDAESYLAFSDAGLLAFVEGDAPWDAPTTRFAWLSRDGEADTLPFVAHHDDSFALAPGGERLAVARYDAGSYQLWIYDLERGTSQQLTRDGMDFDPGWDPSGDLVTFTALEHGTFDLWEIAADGSRPAQPLRATEGDEGHILWAPGGRSAAFQEWTQNGRDVWGRFDGEDPTDRPILATPADEKLMGFSRDGRWLAFAIDDEIYAADWPAVGQRTLIARRADFAQWSPASDELIYAAGGQLVSVGYSAIGGTLRLGAEKPLFALPLEALPRPFAVSPDGQRVLLRLHADGRPRERIRIVQDGFSLVR